MSLIKTIIIFLSIYLFFIQISFANQNIIETKFIPATTYSTKNGLPSNNIQDIIEDENGFLWLGTQKGLSRFDSSGFLNFSKNKSNDKSLPDIHVEELLQMPNNELWMSIDDFGINVFNKFNHQSTNFKNDQSNLFTMSNSLLFGMAKDRDNNVWFSIYGEGIYQWDVKQNKFYLHSQDDPESWITSKKPFEILIDSHNRLWVCTIDSMVFRFDLDTGKSKSFNFSTDTNDPLSSPIYSFAESKNGEIYAGGYSGVFKYDETLETFQSIVSETLLTNYHNGNHSTVREIMLDSKDNLWIGTTRSLLLYSNNTLNKISFYENGEKLNSQWTIHSIIEGNDGNIWIGTEGLGLIKLSPDWDRYKIYISNTPEPFNIIQATQFENKILLAHQSLSKIDILEDQNGSVSFIKSLTPDLGNNSTQIDHFFQNSPDSIWVSSLNGIHKVDIDTGKSTMITNEQGRKLGNVKLIFKARDNRFYFNLFSEALGYIDENEMIGHIIPNTKTNHLKGNSVNQISDGLDDSIWIATNQGIESYHFNTKQFGLVYKSNNKQGVSNFYIDGDLVWIISEGGLYQLNWDNHKLHLKQDKFNDILPLIDFSKIKSLNKETLLMTTNDSGLIELNVNTLDHKVFTTENGLPSNTLIDILYSGQTPVIVTESGIALYNDKFVSGTIKKPIVIIDTLHLGENKLPINNTEKLVLDYNYGSLNFDVAMLSFNNSSSIEFEYLLEGNNDIWLNTGNDDKYSFLNLSAGDYTFKVRGRINYGIWSEPASYSFSVEAAPWKSGLAYFIYTLVFLGISSWLYYLYKRKRRYEYEIIKQQTQKQIAHEASKAKSDFLARVSHEVRTPLNGVLGMGELMLDTNMDEEQQIYAETILTSGKHLLDIINDILDLSKIEAGKLELEIQNFDLLKLVDEIVLSFTSQTKQSNLLFICLFDPHIARYRSGDIIRLKQILFNLLSNAFKFTKKGQIILELSSCPESEKLDVKVSDTGIGLDPNAAGDLFKPFVQADPTVTRKYGGTGLGLAIVKQLVEKMNGFIEVDGAPGQGSVFHFQVQLETSSNKPVMDIKSQHESIALLTNNKKIQQSISNYFILLNQNYTNTVTNNTTLIITDTDDLKLNSKRKIDTLFINTNIKQSHKNIIYRKNSLSLPITFKKIKEICQGKHIKPIETEENSEKSFIVSQKVLYVEDNVINQHVGIEMIEKMGHLIDVVDNVDEALIMLNRNIYDLLLVDYHLPLKNGISLIENWENSRNIPILVITADLTDEVYQNCQKLKVKQIVSKPFSQIQLHEAIESAFGD